MFDAVDASFDSVALLVGLAFEGGWSAAPAAGGLGVRSGNNGSVRARSALVNVTSALFATGMTWADSSTLRARRRVTTDPLPDG